MLTQGEVEVLSCALELYEATVVRGIEMRVVMARALVDKGLVDDLETLSAAEQQLEQLKGDVASLRDKMGQHATLDSLFSKVTVYGEDGPPLFGSQGK